MKNNKASLNIADSRIISIMLLVLSAALTFGGMLTLTDAAALDGDHFQDANGVNTTVTNQVVRKGWGYVPGNGLFAIEDTPINYGITFDELPFLIVKFANSRQIGDGAPANLAECETTRNVIAAGVNQTNSGFKPILRTPTGLGFPSITNYCYTWIAIGRHDSSYDAGGSGGGDHYTGHVRTLATGTRYATPSGETTDQGTYEYSASLVGSSCTAKNLYVEMLNNVPADSSVFTFMKNNSSTSLSCTVNTGSTTCNDTANSVSLSAGDDIAFSITTGSYSAGTNAEMAFAWTCE